MKWIAFLSLPLYALDQISKYWILRHVDAESQIPIIPRWFYLVNVPNTGAAFGSYKNRPPRPKTEAIDSREQTCRAGAPACRSPKLATGNGCPTSPRNAKLVT